MRLQYWGLFFIALSASLFGSEMRWKNLQKVQISDIIATGTISKITYGKVYDNLPYIPGYGLKTELEVDISEYLYGSGRKNLKVECFLSCYMNKADCSFGSKAGEISRWCSVGLNQMEIKVGDRCIFYIKHCDEKLQLTKNSHEFMGKIDLKNKTVNFGQGGHRDIEKTVDEIKQYSKLKKENKIDVLKILCEKYPALKKEIEEQKNKGSRKESLD